MSVFTLNFSGHWEEESSPWWASGSSTGENVQKNKGTQRTGKAAKQLWVNVNLLDCQKWDNNESVYLKIFNIFIVLIWKYRE